jgi:membrane protease YdiL (CAAX protease family)
LAYLHALRKPLTSIGLHARNLDSASLVGILSLVTLYGTLYSIQFYLLSTAGQNPRVTFGAIDRNAAAMGGPFFTGFYVFGQVANALMEEFIFRGVMLPLLMVRFHFAIANMIQALLFGLAHLVFPLGSWASGQATAGGALAEAASLLLFTTVGGLVFGYLYYRTSTLWTAVFAHLTDNSIGLFFHIQTTNRLNAETDVLMLASLGFVGLVILTWAIAKRSHLPTLKPWGT